MERVKSSLSGRLFGFAKKSQTHLFLHQLMSKLMQNGLIILSIKPGVSKMRTTVNIDDELLARAHAATHITAKAELIQEALKALVERESARQLAKLGGSQAGLRSIPRRRFADDSD